MKTINPQIQRGQQDPGTKYIKQITARHILIKLLKTSNKKKILKATRGKQKTSYVQKNKDETLLIRKHARKTVNNIFQVLKRKNCQPRISMHRKNIFQK